MGYDGYDGHMAMDVGSSSDPNGAMLDCMLTTSPPPLPMVDMVMTHHHHGHHRDGDGDGGHGHDRDHGHVESKEEDDDDDCILVIPPSMVDMDLADPEDDGDDNDNDNDDDGDDDDDDDCILLIPPSLVDMDMNQPYHGGHVKAHDRHDGDAHDREDGDAHHGHEKVHGRHDGDAHENAHDRHDGDAHENVHDRHDGDAHENAHDRHDGDAHDREDGDAHDGDEDAYDREDGDGDEEDDEEEEDGGDDGTVVVIDDANSLKHGTHSYLKMEMDMATCSSKKDEGSKAPIAIDHDAVCSPLWVKWRGKWQAGIQCSLGDCPASTMKAMPTYGRKTYIVVYFPRSRSYVWADGQYVRSIKEYPEPLAFGTYESGRRSVSNLGIARQCMIRRIVSQMLDVSDRLPIQVVVDSAREVSFWKDFAKEMAMSSSYSELGIMLVKLKEMIMPIYFNEGWVDACFDEWKRKCLSAKTAGSFEGLVKDLKDAINWDKVEKIWDASEQTNLGSDWRSWKAEVQRVRLNASKSRRLSAVSTNNSTPSGCSTPLKNHLAHSSNSAGDDECRGTERTNSVLPETSNNKGMLTAPVELMLENGSTPRCHAYSHRRKRQCNNPSTGGGVYCYMHRPSCQIPVNNHLAHSSNSADDNKCGMERTNLALPETADNKGLPRAPVERMLENGSTSRCQAYSERRKRQCNNSASGEDIYCYKHRPPFRNVPRKKMKEAEETTVTTVTTITTTTTTTKTLPLTEATGVSGHTPVCSGMTRYGRQCTHRSQKGSVFCKKHLLQDVVVDSRVNETVTNGLSPPSPSGKKRKYEGGMGSKEEEEESSMVVPTGKSPTSSSRVLQRVTTGWTRCIGWCKGNGGQCSHRAKPGSLHCEKHVPPTGASLSSASYGPASDDILVQSARDLLREYMVACLADGAAEDGRQREANKRILSEASKDINAAETLFNLVTVEKETLGKMIADDERIDGGDKKPLARIGIGIAASNVAPTQIPLVRCMKKTYTCRLCPFETDQLVDLGQHWRNLHKKESRGFFRGYDCQQCDLHFTYKRALERHWNRHHQQIPFPTLSELAALCIICSKTFTNFEELWKHVVPAHPDKLRKLGESSLEKLVMAEVVVSESIMCSSCKQTFASQSELQHHQDTAHSQLMPTEESAHFKYKCKYCDERFQLLPELGRHHQAQHRLQQMTRMNTIDTGDGTNELSSFSITVEKKRLQKLDIRRSNLNVKSEALTDPLHQNGSGDALDLPVAEMEDCQGPKILGSPSNKDILAIARLVCCKNMLHCVLQTTHETLPESLSGKAAKLCMEANVNIQWHHEGFICPNGCKEVLDSVEVNNSFALPLSLPRASFTPLQITGQSSNPVWNIKEEGIKSEAPPPAADNHSSYKAVLDKIVVLCEDVSFGQERVPIPCVIDRDLAETMDNNTSTSRPWDNFSYVTRRLLDPSLGLHTESSQLGCTCQEPRCSPERCEHVYLFDNDNNDAKDIYGHPMCRRFPYDSHGRIILEEGYLVYECNSLCNCEDECQNRVLQKGVVVKLEILKTRHKGWAVRAAEPIRRGTFVCEYIGEVVDDGEANRRGERYDKEGCSYLYDIDAHIDTRFLGRKKPFVIDATKYGNVARFINHSCSPNLVNYQVLVESMDCQLAHIGLYASRDIDAGEELAYDYRYKLLPGKGCPCHCGARNCRGRLY